MGPRVFRALCLLAAAFLIHGVFAPRAGADMVQFRSDFDYISSDSTTTNKTTGETTTSAFSSLDQQYNLDFSKNIFPYLTFSAGGLFEEESATSRSEDTETESKERLMRPFADLALNAPFYNAGLRYDRFQTETELGDLPDTALFRDTWDSVFRWRPAGLLPLNLRYTESHTYDDPETLDSITRGLNFDTKYSPWQPLQANYSYTRDEVEDEIGGSGTLNQGHNGRISYADHFFKNRVSLGAGYNVRRSTFEFTDAGVGLAEFPLLRSSGLSSVDNTPQDGPALSLNAALIDGNLTASSGIDIGLSADETSLTNIGLDFGFPVEVERIHLWVDRRLPQAIADSFSWSIYTSPDNTDDSTWTLVTTVAPAPFGAIDNRFEISFPAVNARFIKVAVRPLSPAVLNAVSFPNILITEMQAFQIVSGAGGVVPDRRSTLDQDYSLSLRGRLSQKTTLGYSLFYRTQEEDPVPNERSAMSNDLFFSHIFNQRYSSSASLSRAETTREDEKSITTTYSTALRADYFETLGQTLSYSGSTSDAEEGSSSRNSLFLRTNARLYRGWSAYLDLGYSLNTPPGGQGTTSTIIRTGTNVEPSRKMILNLDYSLTMSSEEEEGDGTLGGGDRSELSLQVFYVPFRTLSLNARYQINEDRDDKRSLQQYSLNWSPFPGGGLQFFFNLNETLSPEEGQRTRTIGPSARWSISRHAFLEAFYNITESETELQTVSPRSVGANLRLTF